MSEAYQETREIPGHHMLQGNDLFNEIFWIVIRKQSVEYRGFYQDSPEFHEVLAEVLAVVFYPRL